MLVLVVPDRHGKFTLRCWPQKITFPANHHVRCPLRLPASLENCGPLAVAVMAPKFAADLLSCGLPKLGVFVTANALARNWKFTRSVIRKFRSNPVSISKKPGPRRMSRPAVPYAAEVADAARGWAKELTEKYWQDVVVVAQLTNFPVVGS